MVQLIRMLVVLKIVEGRNNQKIYKKLRSIKTDSEDGIKLAYKDIGQSLKRQIFADLDSPDKTGRLYIIFKDSQRFLHQASAPGEPPATLFGGLKASINPHTNASDTMSLSAGNENTVKYAKRLELGDAKIAPRPYLKKAIDDQEKEIFKYFTQWLCARLGKFNNET